MAEIRIGVIGGSGLYSIAGLKGSQERQIETPYGQPSDAIVTGSLGDVPVAFLARHGRSHGLLPGEIPYRANIYALKTLGVRYLISVSAVGSLREGIAPLGMVLPDQFIDFTKSRPPTFFGGGAVAHVSMADPVCPVVADILAAAFARQVGNSTALHRGGTYACIEGPAFSSRAESEMYRMLGASVIGMTGMPEARLAREAEMAYAVLALVTDFDCWHPQQTCVSAEMAIANLRINAERAQAIVTDAIAVLAATWPASAAHEALRSALVTPPAHMSSVARTRLFELLKGYLPS